MNKTSNSASRSSILDPAELFTLSPEEEQVSKTIYNGKIIKCLVAPHHTFAELEAVLKYTLEIYLFPEREMKYTQTAELIARICVSKQDNVKIVTTNMNIITDMVGECVRYLDENMDVETPGVKTFGANIHEIRYNLLERHILYGAGKNGAKNFHHSNITTLIERINRAESTGISASERRELLDLVKLIGEDLIRNKLIDMISGILSK